MYHNENQASPEEFNPIRLRTQMKKLVLIILFLCTINGMRRSPRKNDLFKLYTEDSSKKIPYTCKSNESLAEGLKRFDKEHPGHK